MRGAAPLLALTFLTSAVFPGQSYAKDGLCGPLMSPAATNAEGMKTISPADLAQLRDFGGFGTATAASPFSLSPDGRLIAIVLRQADPLANGYCIRVVVAPADGNAEPIVIDSYDEVGPTAFSRDRTAWVRERHPLGLAADTVPSWSPDGRWIAFIKREGSVSRVWRAAVRSQSAEAVTPADMEVDEFTWDVGGNAIVFSTSQSLVDATEAKIKREGLSGFHYDHRFVPFRSGGRPTAIVEGTPSRYTVNLESKDITPAAAAVPSELGVLSSRRNRLGNTVRVSLSDPNVWFSPKRLDVSIGGGSWTPCTDSACLKVVDAWWSDDGATIYFLREEGWGASQLAMYRWQPGATQPRRTFATNDLLIGCQMLGARFLCAHEGAVQPRRIVRVDPDSGAMTPVYDPNPEVARWRLGAVERLFWSSERGTEVFGDLVLPPDHRPGQKHPMIVTTYASRGFLRGGVGDEYPIQAFAARGFAVLSFHRPKDVGFVPGARTTEDIERSNLKGWGDRMNVQSALEKGVAEVVARGVVDPYRVGITGLSEGSAISIWALNHSKLFAAAAISSCCTNELGNSALQGPKTAAFFNRSGYPALLKRDTEFWKMISLESNVETMRTPLLMQLADDEFLLTVSTIAAAEEADSPIDFFIFPDESHIKWQPAHRLAVYERNLAWFDFWLRGVESDDPSRADDIARWRRWRDARQ